MRRGLLNLLTVLSLLLCVAAVTLWVRTEVGDNYTIEWGPPGVFRCVESSTDGMQFYFLSDPGFGPMPLRWQHYRNGWAQPPAPSNPAAVPPWSVTWMMPSPAIMEAGQYTASGIDSAGRRVPATASYGGVPSAGFEYAMFPGYYGPGTSLRTYRLSYFVVLLPSAVLPAMWLARTGYSRFRFQCYPPGHCSRCGYDLRATPDRCPECGTSAMTLQ